ncbi:MAG TPA: LacI family DNA-binding transcriptional regulator [Phototrophicaceae bacterium]|nr:LacI family DNA-binding transcriptional regulator [Phototrophicaceae bacterium]
MVDKKKTVTIRDIARMANVSYQTVSLVINDKPGVSDPTRQRVQQVMQELDYHPNKVARMLTTNRSHTLELFVVDVQYGGRLADSTKNMAHVAKEAGYSLLISEAESSHLGEAFDSAAARMIDGIVMYAPRLKMSDRELDKLCNGLPLVRRDYVPGSKLAWVGFDQVYATRLAVEHLLELGHQHIAAIPPDADLINGYWRYTTWKNVLLENGLEPGPSCAGDYSMKSGYEAAHKLLDSGQYFTALMVGTDGMAQGALRALHERGLRVPRDISVISFDNTELASYTEPPLTTVEFRFLKQDEIAIKYLIEIINDPNMELHQRVLMADLVLRESTRPIHK